LSTKSLNNVSIHLNNAYTIFLGSHVEHNPVNKWLHLVSMTREKIRKNFYDLMKEKEQTA